MPETEYHAEPKKFAGLIYLITNKINGKQYVGQTTTTVDKRWRDHVATAKSGKGHCHVLYRAIRKYGSESFTAVAIVMPPIVSHRELDAAEKEIISRIGSLKPSGYNLKAGGDGGGTHHPETKAKMSELRKGKPSGMKGRKHTPEAIARMCLAQSNRPPVSAEVRLKMSKAGKGRRQTPEHVAKRTAPLKGRPIAQWRAAKMHAACRGKPLSPEHRAKISKTQIGQKRPPEVGAKISAALTGRKQSEQTRAKISAFAKRRTRSSDGRLFASEATA